MNNDFDPHNPGDISSEVMFEAAVRAFGGVRISDFLGVSPTFKNADWVFPRRFAIVEHKELRADFRKAPSFESSEIALRLKYVQEGRANIFGMPNPDARREFSHDYMQLYRKPLRRIVEAASTQLRETRSHLQWSRGCNILVISNVSITDIIPLGICVVIQDILEQIKLDIDGVVYVTNHYVDIPESNLAHNLWLSIYSPIVETRRSTINFIDAFGHAFLAEAAMRNGDTRGTVRQFRSGSDEALNVLRAVPIKRRKQA